MPRLDLLSLGAILAYITGLVWRFYYIFIAHPATNYVYSDMKMYVDDTLRLLDPLYQPSIIDTLHPPGTHILFAILLKIYPSWDTVIVMQFILSAAIPLLLAAIGTQLYGRKVALLALAGASLYPAFISYAGFFLSENFYIFFSLLSTLFLVKSLKSQITQDSIGWGVLAGFMFGITAAFRSVIVPTLLLLCLFLFFVWKKYSYKNVLISLVTTGCMVIAVLIPLAVRCTSLNENRFCLVDSHAIGGGVLMGHYGETGPFYFEDAKRNLYYMFGGPAAAQKGYTAEAHFPFGEYDGRESLAAAWRWTKENPWESLHLSIGNMYDLMGGTIPWPGVDTNKRMLILSEQLFQILILFPAGYYIVKNFSTIRTTQPSALADILMIIPLVSMLILAFFTIAEPRYRIPIDGFLMILAARAYTQRTSLENNFIV